ncbi:MAG: phosphate uptake regulator PhoU, partial [Candidatus Bathyarchaeota archaeon]
MEIRKLQKIRGGSFTLSIPKKWVDRMKLKTGQQMFVSEEDGYLSIFPITKLSEKPSTVTLQLKELLDPEALEYNITTYYIQGADRIDIVSKEIIPAEQKRKLKLLR